MQSKKVGTTKKEKLNDTLKSKLCECFGGAGNVYACGADIELRFNQITAGKAELSIPYQDEFSFSPGQLQATPIFAAADFVVVSLVATLHPEGWVDATLGCTLKIVGPANGPTLLVRGKVLKASKRLTVSQAHVYSYRDGNKNCVPLCP